MLKYSVVALLASCCLAALSVSALAPAAPAAPASLAAHSPAAATHNLGLELKIVLKTIPRKQIKYLLQAYLLNDSEFQAVVRTINSIPAYRLRQLCLNQPEVRQLWMWLSQQLIASGSSVEIFDQLEFTLFNKYIYWAQVVNGMSGFQQEFINVYPADLVRSVVESTAEQSPVFAELWRRVIALRPAFERCMATPLARSVIDQLARLGVNVKGVDRLIYHQMGWSNGTFQTDPPSYDYTDYLYQ